MSRHRSPMQRPDAKGGRPWLLVRWHGSTKLIPKPATLQDALIEVAGVFGLEHRRADVALSFLVDDFISAEMTPQAYAVLGSSDVVDLIVKEPSSGRQRTSPDPATLRAPKPRSQSFRHPSTSRRSPLLSHFRSPSLGNILVAPSHPTESNAPQRGSPQASTLPRPASCVGLRARAERTPFSPSVPPPVLPADDPADDSLPQGSSPRLPPPLSQSWSDFRHHDPDHHRRDLASPSSEAGLALLLSELEASEAEEPRTGKAEVEPGPGQLEQADVVASTQAGPLGRHAQEDTSPEAADQVSPPREQPADATLAVVEAIEGGSSPESSSSPSTDSPSSSSNGDAQPSKTLPIRRARSVRFKFDSEHESEKLRRKRTKIKRSKSLKQGLVTPAPAPSAPEGTALDVEPRESAPSLGSSGSRGANDAEGLNDVPLEEPDGPSPQVDTASDGDLEQPGAAVVTAPTAFPVQSSIAPDSPPRPVIDDFAYTHPSLYRSRTTAPTRPRSSSYSHDDQFHAFRTLRRRPSTFEYLDARDLYDDERLEREEALTGRPYPLGRRFEESGGFLPSMWFDPDSDKAAAKKAERHSAPGKLQTSNHRSKRRDDPAAGDEDDGGIIIKKKPSQKSLHRRASLAALAVLSRAKADVAVAENDQRRQPLADITQNLHHSPNSTSQNASLRPGSPFPSSSHRAGQHGSPNSTSRRYASMSDLSSAERAPAPRQNRSESPFEESPQVVDQPTLESLVSLRLLLESMASLRKRFTGQDAVDDEPVHRESVYDWAPPAHHLRSSVV